MKILSTLLISFLLLSSFAQAQEPAKVTGKVEDADGEALPFATVLLMSSADTSLIKAGYTDESGVFRLFPLSAGTYWVEVKFTGMATYRSEPFVLIDGQQEKLPTIGLKADGVEVDEVKIRAERPLITVKPDMTVFNVENSINAIGNDALELLRKAPGVIVDQNDNILLLGKNGVRVYIDGKPSPLSASDLATMLRSMQSSQIESIEIITNPSSKYEAEGNAGIINIKLKKDKRFGTNANLSLGYAVAIFSKYNGSLTVNHRNSKLNAFGTYSAFNGLNRNYFGFYREQNSTSFDQNSVMINDNLAHNFKAGVDYFAGEKSTIGVVVNGFLSSRDWSNSSTTDIVNLETGEPISTLEAESMNDGESDNVNFNLNYRFDDGEGQSLSMDADYGFFQIRTNSFQPNYYISPGGGVLAENIFSSQAPTDIDIGTFKADYENKLFDGKLGAGIKFSYVSTANTFDFYDVINGVEFLDSARSNTFEYTENVNAAYVNWQRQFGKIGVQAGLRVEQTNSLGELTSTQNTGNDRVERHYLNFFPSGGLTWQINQENVSRLTYSRRIDRPRYQDLNPFEFKLDELTYQRGNPFLQPQYTHSIQLGHTWKYAYNATLSYSLTEDYFTDITDTTESTRTYINKQNLSTRTVWSLNAGAPVSPVKWFSTYTSVTVFHARNEADFEEDSKDINIAQWSWNLFSQWTIKLPMDFSLQLTGFYNSPSIWGANYRNNEFWGLEAGAAKRFLNGRGNLRVVVSDLLYTMQWRGVQNFGGLYMDASGGWESRQFKVNLTYMLGNQKVKGSKRKTGLEEEGKRVNTSGQ